jgi:hypothetical protein
MNYGAVGLAMAVLAAYILHMLSSFAVWKYWKIKTEFVKC